GFFLAPHVVGESLKGAVYTARLLEKLHITTAPAYHEKRTDLIQSITFDNQEKMIAFCQLVQANSPINSYVAPYPSEMPGYEEVVIIADGTFIQRASIELTIYGTIIHNYNSFIQG